MLISRNLHKKSSEVSIKAKSTPESLSFKGQETKHTTVKWSIGKDISLAHKMSAVCFFISLYCFVGDFLALLSEDLTFIFHKINVPN